MALPTDNRAEQRKLDELFKPEDLSHEKIKSSPVLRPLAEINRLYLNNALLIERHLKEMDNINQLLKEMETQNPRYKQMMLWGVLGDYKNNAAQLVHTLILQKDSLKDAIGEMLRIINIEYALKNEEFDFRRPIDSDIENLSTEVKEQNIVYTPEPIESVPIEKLIPDIKPDDGFTPIESK